MDGMAWDPQTQIRYDSSIPSTSDGPALFATQTKSGMTTVPLLYVAWKGVNDNFIYYTSSTDGKTWASQGQLPGISTSNSPALFNF